MKVLLIEDELPAREKLEAMLKEAAPDLNVIAKIGSVKESIEWFRKNDHPSLAFVDIHLSDDHSFEIFRNVDVKCPVIFTTAFDKYLLESFEFNAIDYLLKPVTLEKLKRALEKIERLKTHFTKENIQKLLRFVSGQGQKERLLVKKGIEYLAVPVAEIAYIFSDHKITFLRDHSGNQYLLDKTLGELESELDKNLFFRINRKFIAGAKAIDRFRSDNGKIRVFLKPEVKEEVFVSKETAPEFRKWMGR